MRNISMLAVALCLFVLSACGSSAPPDDVIKESAARMIAAQIHLGSAPLDIIILDDWKITNDYTKVVNDEEGYLYEFKTNLKVRGWDGSKIIADSIHDYGPMAGIVALVKRGKKWYSVQ